MVVVIVDFGGIRRSFFVLFSFLAEQVNTHCCCFFVVKREGASSVPV